MYLPDNNRHMPQNSYKLGEINDIYQLYALKYPEVSVMPVRSSYSSFLLLALTFEFHYMTFENFNLFFPDILSRNGFMNVCNHLIKRSLMKSERFSMHDNASYTAYCLTAKGLSHIKALLSDGKEHNEKIRRTGGHVAMHDYCAGINLFHFFCSPFRYEWSKEVMVTDSAMKTKASLCADVFLSIHSVLFGPDDAVASVEEITSLVLKGANAAYTFKSYRKRLYIEEDLGTETTGTLLSKIASYDEHGLLTSDAILLFSTRKCGISYDGEEYSHRKVNLIIKHMEEAGVTSLYDYLSSCDKKDYQTVRLILLKVGVIKPDTSTVGVDIRLGGKTKRDFTIDELKRYRDELENYRNLYRIRDYHAEQMRFTRTRKESLVSVLERYMEDPTRIERRELLLLLSGHAVYFLSTNLLGNSFSFLFPDLYDLDEKMQQSLKGYFYSKAANNRLLTVGDPEDELPTVLIRNCYTPDGEKGTLIVEDIGHDLSAMVRVLYLRKYYRPEDPFAVVSIVETYEDAYSFAKRLNYYRSTATMPRAASGYFYILSSDLGAEEKIFSVGDVEGLKPFYLKPDTGDKKTLADFLF